MVDDAEAAEEEAEDEAAGYRIKNKNPTQRCGEKNSAGDVCYHMVQKLFVFWGVWSSHIGNPCPCGWWSLEHPTTAPLKEG